MSLTFNEELHEYRWNGVLVPNVTRILEPLTNYGAIPADRLEIARQKGTAVHRMVELEAKGDLDEEGLPEWLQPVLVKWRAFVADTGFRIEASERRVYSSLYGYAGTFDLFGYMDHAHIFAMVDLKRSFFAGDAIGIQISAYLVAYLESKTQPHRHNVKRYALRLNETGPIRLQEYTDLANFGEFLTLLSYPRVLEKYVKS